MNRLLPIIIGALVALGLAQSMIFIVDQRQFAIKYALGEIREVIDKPGLYFKLPAPFQNIDYYDKRILTIDNSEIDRFVTSEKVNVLLDSYIKWRIVDPTAYIRSVQGSERVAQDRILRILRDALQNEVARMTMADVVSEQRDKLVEKVRSKVREDSKTIGVDIVDVRLKRVDFEPNVQERVFARMQSERKRVANERRATGSAESEKIRADADRQREVLLGDAYRDAQLIKGEGDAKAAGIYAEAFGRNPDFAEFYRSLQAYNASFANRSDVMVLDPSADFFKYFKGSTGASVK